MREPSTQDPASPSSETSSETLSNPCPRCASPTETRTIGRWDPARLYCTTCTWNEQSG